jgi:hypothetical protein
MSKSNLAPASTTLYTFKLSYAEKLFGLNNELTTKTISATEIFIARDEL